MQNKPLNTLHAGNTLRRLFAGSLMVTAMSCGGSSRQDAPASPTASASPCADANYIEISFAPRATPALIGEDMEGMSGDDRSGMVAEWKQIVGDNLIQMRDPEKAAVFAAWMSQLPDLRGASDEDKLKAVNHLVDTRLMYETDDNTYGKPERWATPFDIVARGMGDCEDFAILRYFMLRGLGVAAEKMFIVRLDTSARVAGGHMALLFGGQISESTPPVRTPAVEQAALSQPARTGYTLYYAANEIGVWRSAGKTVSVWGEAEKISNICVRMPNGARAPVGI